MPILRQTIMNNGPRRAFGWTDLLYDLKMAPVKLKVGQTFATTLKYGPRQA